MKCRGPGLSFLLAHFVGAVSENMGQRSNVLMPALASEESEWID